MKQSRRENAPSGNTAAVGTDWQQYYTSLKQRLALSDIDANAVVTEQINAINRQPIDSLIACPPNPPDGFPDATSLKFYYLSEIVGDDIPPGSPECGAALACFLSWIVARQINPDDNPAQVHSHATLVVDRDCVVRQTLTLPNQFTLAGVGPNGGGFLSFEDLPDGASALRFAPTVGSAIRMTTIRDIGISGGASCCGQVGINVSNSQFVYVDRVRMNGFAFGVFGETAYSNFISNSNIHNNGFALMMGEDARAWRVRDSVMNQNLIGVVITENATGHVISGARIESNPVTGVFVNGSMNVIESSWFEGNGTLPQGSSPGPTHHGIRITNLAQKTRVLSNVFSSQLIGDAGTETQSCFNMSFAPNSGNVNQENCR